MFSKIKNLLFFIIFINFSMPVFARCAVCYTKGLSGASIALIVIIVSAIFLFIANRFLQKFLEKNKFNIYPILIIVSLVKI